MDLAGAEHQDGPLADADREIAPVASDLAVGPPDAKHRSCGRHGAAVIERAVLRRLVASAISLSIGLG